ncbi:hypothetical protein Tco_0299320 [Tanacetum coccineum]
MGSRYRTHKTVYAIGIPEEIVEDEGDIGRMKVDSESPCTHIHATRTESDTKAKVVREEEQDYELLYKIMYFTPLDSPDISRITPPDDGSCSTRATNPIFKKAF